MPEPIDILSLTSEQFVHRAASFGTRRPAALALYREVFRGGGVPTDRITLPSFPIARTHTEDETIKFILRHDDGLETESVILPIIGSTGKYRHTLCVSSQVGCAMGCTFCETAQMGFLKNLMTSQILAQWHAAKFHFRADITNIVFMGMGEPMENIDAVIQAIRVFADRNGPHVAPAKISVSTVGRIQGIERLARLATEPGFHKLRLAVSINSPNDEIRSSIMPINRSAPMAELMQAMMKWPCGNDKRILIEYVLIPGVNDAMEHADELREYLRPLPCTVNVIPYNPRRNSPWPAPRDEDVRRFIDRLHFAGQFVKRRQTMGRSVMAACGQLGNEHIRGRKLITLGRA